MLPTGLYEQLINKLLRSQLALQGDKLAKTMPLEKEEVPRILAAYLAKVIEKGLHNLKDKQASLETQLELANELIDTLVRNVGEESLAVESVDKAGEMLLALIDRKNSIYALNEKAEIPRPVTSLAESSLFTGAVHEPDLFTELKREIISCDRIDMLVSFIKWSGLRLIIEELRRFTEAGGILRVITTPYMGATDVKAIEELRELPNTEIKVSYDTKRTRLHAKAYVFYRNTGFTTAYVGSSNLSNAALSSGLEWNVKITAMDQPATLQKVEATFESYWHDKEFEVYSVAETERLAKALRSERYRGKEEEMPYLFDILPFSYQQEILDRLEVERRVREHYRNLIVAATGTGKTVISAFDYLRFRRENKGKPCRLLFVAHREEILKQSLACFRGVLKDANFGELYVGGYKPESINHLFISIQTFNSKELDLHTSPDFYDYIIVDEFHRAAAPTYQRLLSYYEPMILLGLTATPERMDGKSILEHFDQRIAAEIRLPEAIDRKLLCPFQYFGVSDEVDLRNLKWDRGGYERRELSKVYTGNDLRVNLIVKAIRKYTTDVAEIKGLGFCVSKEHAEYMADSFNRFGMPSMFLTADSKDEARDSAQARLVGGEIRFIFVVDLYNEGVDIPAVNTILFLRPTESLTVFLQQLGRGLRLAEDKECLTVLDFIGQANRKYNFEDKFVALLSATGRSVQKEIKEGFTSLPKGCYIQLERKARDYILETIRSSYSSKAGLVARIASFSEDTELELTLENFLGYYHMELKGLYKFKDSFARLCVLAKVRADFVEPLEVVLSKALRRIGEIDSRRWISFLLEILSRPEGVELGGLSEEETRMLMMFHFTVWQKSLEDCGFASLAESLRQLYSSPVLLEEILEILRYNYDRIDFMDETVDLGFACPLDLHCTYSRDQILVAMDFLKPGTVQGGVKYLPEEACDVLFITLNKSEKDYSPSTMYHDYSINERLFHWQSQSTTAADSKTGQRYINHKANESKVLLFVREYKNDPADSSKAMPYTFLGLADYVRHEGSRPMNVTWRLHRPIPAKYLRKTNKLIVG